MVSKENGKTKLIKLLKFLLFLGTLSTLFAFLFSYFFGFYIFSQSKFLVYSYIIEASPAVGITLDIDLVTVSFMLTAFVSFLTASFVAFRERRLEPQNLHNKIAVGSTFLSLSVVPLLFVPYVVIPYGTVLQLNMNSLPLRIFVAQLVGNFNSILLFLFVIIGLYYMGLHLVVGYGKRFLRVAVLIMLTSTFLSVITQSYFTNVNYVHFNTGFPNVIMNFILPILGYAIMSLNSIGLFLILFSMIAKTPFNENSVRNSLEGSGKNSSREKEIVVEPEYRQSVKTF